MAENNAVVGVDANIAPAAKQLTESGMAGVAIIFLCMIFLLWRYLWGRIERLDAAMKEERASFDAERKEFSRRFDERHEQFISLLQNANTTMAAANEISRKEEAIMSQVGETLRRVNRSIGRCERAQIHAPSKEEDIDNE